MNNNKPRARLLDLIQLNSPTQIDRKNGSPCTPEVIQALMEIAFSNSDTNASAMAILEQIDSQSLLDETGLIALKSHRRLYYDHKDIEMLLGVISILLDLVDFQAGDQIGEFAHSSRQSLVQSTIIEAFSKYSKTCRQEITDPLPVLDRGSKVKDTELAGDILAALAKVGLQEIIQYLDDPDAKGSVSAFKAGNKHVLKQINTRSQLNPDVPAMDQLELLRQSCLDALKKKRIQKSSVNRNNIRPPLFTKIETGTNENFFKNGVNFNTGCKFLNGGCIGEAKAQMIFDRLRRLCPDLFMASVK